MSERDVSVNESDEALQSALPSVCSCALLHVMVTQTRRSLLSTPLHSSPHLPLLTPEIKALFSVRTTLAFTSHHNTLIFQLIILLHLFPLLGFGSSQVCLLFELAWHLIRSDFFTWTSNPHVFARGIGT